MEANSGVCDNAAYVTDTSLETPVRKTSPQYHCFVLLEMIY